MTTEIKPIRLTKSGKPDRRAETSRANVSKAQQKVKQILEKSKPLIEDEFEEDGDDEFDFSSESEIEEEEIQKVVEKPKRKAKQILDELNSKVEMLMLNQKPKEEIKEEPKKEVEKVMESVKELIPITLNGTKHPVFSRLRF